MNHPIFKIFKAILLGILVIMLSSSAQMIISTKTSMNESFLALEKTSTHLIMLIFSILIMLILSKGKLSTYGFTWNMNFQIVKIIFVSLAFGFLSSFIGSLFTNASTKMPDADFTLIETILYVWVMASIAEEIFTRGLIQGYLSSLKHIGFNLSKYYISLPVIVGAIFFGAMHLALLVLGVNIYIVMNIMVFAILLGVIAGYQKEKTNSLIPAIIVHICFNIGGIFLM